MASSNATVLVRGRVIAIPASAIGPTAGSASSFFLRMLTVNRYCKHNLFRLADLCDSLRCSAYGSFCYGI